MFDCTFQIEILLQDARALYGDDISPCSRRTFEDCLVHWSNKISLWFNTVDGSTHSVTRTVDELTKIYMEREPDEYETGFDTKTEQ